MVGLTATPRAEVDRSTYSMFGLEDGYPNYHYELEEAIKERYLVGYNVFDRTSEIMKRGFKYSDLSPEERNQIETEYALTIDGEYNIDSEVINKDKEVSGDKLFKIFFNKDTIKKVLDELWRDGLKVNNGENLGKTIIFAPNHTTAELIVEEFKNLYPKYGNEYCALIDNTVAYSGDLIEKFGMKDKLPQVAVSVDMLDTGIDVPEVLNLVFFRRVKSKIKFSQMIGRGTRLCEDLFVHNSPSRDYFEDIIKEPDFAEQKDKQGFYIFDYCDNFRFFGTFVEPKKVGISLNLTQRLFNMKSELVYGLQAIDYQKDEFCVNYRESLVKELQLDIEALSPAQILVKENLMYVDKFKEKEIWQCLSKLDVHELRTHISELISATPEDEAAKNFDLKIFNIEVSLLDKSQDSTKSQNAIILIAQALSSMASHPQVKIHINTIEKIQTKQYWENLTIQELEELRNELRDLIHLIPRRKSPIYIIDVNDKITENGTRVTSNIAGVKTYEQKVIDYLAENSDKEVIRKIKNLEKINENDLNELENILWNELGTKEDYFKFTKKENLAVFVRSIVGIEQQAINEKFGQFLSENVLNYKQQEFVKTIISYVRENGDITGNEITNSSPFDNYDIERMFGEKIGIVIQIVEKLHSAVLCA